MIRRLWSTAVLAMLIPVCPAWGGRVEGTLRLPAVDNRDLAALDAYPGRANSLVGAHPVVRGTVTDAVISFESLPAAAESLMTPSATPPQLAQKDQAFMPRVLAVAVGTSVDFPNQDPIYHNVFSVSPVKRFDLGKYPRGHSKRVTFGKPGVVQVYCDIHSQMAAFVLVLPHRGFTQPDAAGHFTLPNVPAGHYKLRVWHPDLHELHREVDVPAEGVVSVELEY
ncbi:MAG TPA: carboxypeptidase regulatory-like domain-containing protein [Candidatus Eisenbacteria bacterium]|jgi:plastocyanin